MPEISKLRVISALLTYITLENVIEGDELVRHWLGRLKGSLLGPASVGLQNHHSPVRIESGPRLVGLHSSATWP